MIRSEYDTRLFAIRRVNELEAYLAATRADKARDITRKCEIMRSTELLLNYWRTRL